MPGKIGQMYSNLNYLLFYEEFSTRVTDWARLEGYATDAIIRDAYRKLGEFWSFWTERSREDETTPIQAFVKNYVETVESLPFCKERADDVTNQEIWTTWGITLRILEVS